MTKNKEMHDISKSEQAQELLRHDGDFLKPMLQKLVQEVLEKEMNEALKADKHERNGERLGYRSGYYHRTLVTRVGTLELRVPQDRNGLFQYRGF